MENTTIKRLCYHHSKDMDGHFSGAVLKHKYPNIELRGWDYRDKVPDISEIDGYDEVILIDITFPLSVLLEMGVKTKLTVIDHHISFKKEVDKYNNHMSTQHINFEFIYESKLSACEIGFKHYFGYIPPIVELVGKYDTWRANGTPEWEEQILPMKYYLYGKVSNPTEVDPSWLNEHQFPSVIQRMVDHGKVIMGYIDKQNQTKTEFYSFEREIFGGYRGLCMNTNFFSSDTMSSRFDPEKHDIMMGFSYDGEVWGISLRSIEGGPDVSEIAKSKGGGGHKCAAGFEVKNFEDLFK